MHAAMPKRRRSSNVGVDDNEEMYVRVATSSDAHGLSGTPAVGTAVASAMSTAPAQHPPRHPPPAEPALHHYPIDIGDQLNDEESDHDVFGHGGHLDQRSHDVVTENAHAAEQEDATGDHGAASERAEQRSAGLAQPDGQPQAKKAKTSPTREASLASASATPYGAASYSSCSNESAPAPPKTTDIADQAHLVATHPLAVGARGVGHSGNTAEAGDTGPPAAKRRRLNAKSRPTDQPLEQLRSHVQPAESQAAPVRTDVQGQHGSELAARGQPPPTHSLPDGAVAIHGAMRRAASTWGYGHRLTVTADVIWCRICGHHAASTVRSLAKPCTGPAKGPYVSRLKRLRSGLHPVTKQPLE